MDARPEHVEIAGRATDDLVGAGAPEPTPTRRLLLMCRAPCWFGRGHRGDRTEQRSHQVLRTRLGLSWHRSLALVLA